MDYRIDKLGRQDYQSVWRRMQQFTEQRQADEIDRFWIVEHPPVFTLGLNGKQEHILNPGNIPVVETDRGGQVTYHGPGQLVLYILLNIKRLNKGPRQLISCLENAMISALAQYGLKIEARKDAPGVYLERKKIGSVGLRIKNGCCYHGLSLNNNMDLAPFQQINPCGYAGLEVTQLADQQIHIETYELAVPVLHHIIKNCYR